MTKRRLALALVGAAFGLVIAATPAGTSTSPAPDAPHAALAAGHLVEGLLVVEHPRVLGHVPLAVAAHATALPPAPAHAAITRPAGLPAPAVATSSSAIRGPPA